MFQYLQEGLVSAIWILLDMELWGWPHTTVTNTQHQLPHTATNLQRQIYPPTDCFFTHLCE